MLYYGCYLLPKLSTINEGSGYQKDYGLWPTDTNCTQHIQICPFAPDAHKISVSVQTMHLRSGGAECSFGEGELIKNIGM